MARVFELSAGQVVADKYRIDSIIATGGMGVVVAATHVELAQKVAIKFLREVSHEALARFRREARLLVRLKSPHVARVLDVGALEDDTPFIVMEHLDGSDLATILTERGKLPWPEAVDYVLQAMEAVAEAHALGMVHRDLKPANLFVARDGSGTTTVKVLDFGVSKIIDDRAESLGVTRGGDLTNEGVALGSPGYMSPEQMTSARDVDARADVFSLGALLYRLVSGQPPYKGKTVVSILAVMATEPLRALRSVAPDVPPELAAVVERCLAQDRDARFPTLAHLAQAMLPFAPARDRALVDQISTTLGVARPEEPARAVLLSPERRSRRALLAFAAAVLSACVLAGVATWRLTSARPRAKTIELTPAEAPRGSASAAPPAVSASESSAPVPMPLPSMATPTASTSASSHETRPAPRPRARPAGHAPLTTTSGSTNRR